MNFSIIPPGLQADVASGNLTATSYFLYAVLSSLDEVPSRVELSKISGLSLSAVEKNISLLRKRGWLITERAKVTHGPSLYWLCAEPFRKPAALNF